MHAFRSTAHRMCAPLALALVLATPATQAASGFYTQHNLVSDGAVPADLVDSNLVNAWGLVSSPTSPWWVANNGTGTSTLYNGNTGAKIALTVTVPGAPTGLVFNGGTGFVVSAGGASGPARFIFASEDGSISGWNPGVPPPTSTQAIVAVPASETNVYKGLAIATTTGGDFLYATNFRAGTVDVFDSTFTKVATPGAFTDPGLPAGYAPFGIRNLGGFIYVTYALQDDEKKDDVAGVGHGFVNEFDTAGTLLRRVASKGPLNSPWGLALAPENFGGVSTQLLVGNFGDGRIHAYDPTKLTGNGAFHHSGLLHGVDCAPIAIEGLWSLDFGNGVNAGPKETLFFTAGPFDEEHGLFGKLTLAPTPLECKDD